MAVGRSTQGWTKGKVTLAQALGLPPAQNTVLDTTLPSQVGSALSAQQSANQGTAAQGSGGNINGVDISKLRNPIGPGLAPGRVDMGVDYTGAGPLYAIGAGTITSVYNSGWPGGTFIGLHLDQGPYVYYAENITPSVRVNQRVQAGDLVGRAKGSSPYMEIGWAAPPGTGETMAASSGQSKAGQKKGDPGYYPTGYGVSFNNLLKQLGAKPGSISGPVQGSVP